MSLCGTNGERQTNKVKIEPLSQWKLEAEFRNLRGCVTFISKCNANPILENIRSQNKYYNYEDVRSRCFCAEAGVSRMFLPKPGSRKACWS